MPLDSHDPDLAGLEAALAALAPLPGRLSRDALLFRAGRASVRGRGWAWPWAAAALGLVAATLGVVVVTRPAPATVERVVVVTVPEPALPVDTPAPLEPEPEPAPPAASTVAQGPMNYVQLEKQVLRWGLDGLPASAEAPPPSEPPVTRDSLFRAAPEPSLSAVLFRLGSLFQ